MKKRVLVSIAAVAASVLVLSGCAPSGGGGSEKTLNLLMVQSPSTTRLKTLVPEFTKETGIKVNVDLVPQAGMQAKYNVSLGSGAGQYDVVEAVSTNLSQLTASKWIKPLNSYLDDKSQTPSSYTSGFKGGVLDSLAIDGKTYTIPFEVGADMLYYNKDMFTAAGLDPDNPPTTLTEVLSAAKKLNKPEIGQAGFLARGTRQGNENSFSWIMMWLLNGGRWEDAKGKPKYDVLDEEAARKTTDQYATLMTKYAPSGVGNYGFVEDQAAMQQGKAAMWLDGATLGPSLEDKSASKIAGHVGYAALKGEGGNYIAGAVSGLSVVDTTKNDKEAWQLVQYLTSKKVGIDQALAGVGGTPGRTDVLTDPGVQKLYDPAYLAALSESIKHVNPEYSPVIPQGTEIRGAISVALSKILSGQASNEAAMNEANQEILKILKK